MTAVARAATPAADVATLPPRKVVLFANTGWYLYNFRLPLLERLRDTGCEVTLLAPRDEYTERLAAAGFRWRDIDFQRRSLNPLTQLLVLWRLWSFWRSERPALVHLFTVKCVALGGIAARLAGVPQRVHAIAGLGSVYTDNRRRALRFVVTQVLRLATGGRGSRLIVQNPDDAALLVRAGIARDERVHLIRGSGVDGTRFTSSATRRPGPVRFLFAARLLWAKGIRDFVDAAAALADSDAEFLVAGEPDAGNPDAVDEAFLDECRASNNVRLLGHVEDMAALLADVDVVVLPSRYGEGVPRILVESAASGKPLVAYDVAGSREIVLDGRNGRLLEPGDTTALVDALRALAENAEQRDAFGVASRAHFMTEYDQQIVNAKTLDVYRALDSDLDR